ncbi:hypothetical protein [Methanolapillus millepedarum]|uniref:Uncharacterized protein n=1 Tax=Methanolapillus millepedarum TaxID=3028296 RepID=A0AA96ZTU4_9EURY|nr:hypothetical protein MsAc7_04010 [Methanosarcinaceae archaeon Ac7]
MSFSDKLVKQAGILFIVSLLILVFCFILTMRLSEDIVQSGSPAQIGNITFGATPDIVTNIVVFSLVLIIMYVFFWRKY